MVEYIKKRHNYLFLFFYHKMNEISSISQEFNFRIKDKSRSVETRIAAVRALRTLSISEVCRIFQIHRTTLFRWNKKWNENRNLQSIAKIGPKQKLSVEEIERLLELFRRNPGTTNDQAAAFLNHKIKPQSVSNYLKRAGFTRKEFTDEQENYTNLNQYKKLGLITVYYKRLLIQNVSIWTKVSSTTMKHLDLDEV